MGWPGSSVVSAVTKVGRESPRRVRRPGAGRAVPPGGCTPDPAPPPPGRRRARPRCLPGCGRPRPASAAPVSPVGFAEVPGRWRRGRDALRNVSAASPRAPAPAPPATPQPCAAAFVSAGLRQGNQVGFVSCPPTEFPFPIPPAPLAGPTPWEAGANTCLFKNNRVPSGAAVASVPLTRRPHPWRRCPHCSQVTIRRQV